MDSRAAVRELLERLVEAWNRGSKSDFSRLFTADADYVTASGDWREGRQAIGELLGAGPPPPRIELEGPISIRAHGKVGTAVFRWATKGGTPRQGVITCVVVKQPEGWLIDRLQNTDLR